jgi:uncharacterized membrane protein
MSKKTIFIARSACIAALYVALTMLCMPIAYGPVQFRVSEALTVLPLLFPEAVPGLFVGCLLANLASTPTDVILGSAATLIAAVLTRCSRKIYLGIIPPIVVNALLVPVIFLTIPEIETGYFFNVLTVAAGQAGAVAGLGIPLYFGLKRSRALRLTPKPRIDR